MIRKVCVVAGSSLRYLPYLRLYTDILGEAGVAYEVVYWDRHEEDQDRPGFHRYAKKAKGRGIALLPQYYGFRRHTLEILKRRDFDLYVILGVQIAVFLADFLKGKDYVIDIRDRSHEDNPIYRAIAWRVLAGSRLICVSSPGFKQWLPELKQVVVSHNYSSVDAGLPLQADQQLPGNRLISYIGEVRYFQPNREIMKCVSKIPQWQLAYHGAGPNLEELIQFSKSLGSGNIEFTGRFDPKQKEQFYLKTDFVLCLYGNDHLNVRTLLPNRLYEACAHARPLIVSAGTYLGDVVSRYGLGVVLEPGYEVGLSGRLEAFFDAGKYATFKEGCTRFLGKVLDENEQFRERIFEVVTSTH